MDQNITVSLSVCPSFTLSACDTDNYPCSGDIITRLALGFRFNDYKVAIDFRVKMRKVKVTAA